jgi:hypothetical protein
MKLQKDVVTLKKALELKFEIQLAVNASFTVLWVVTLFTLDSAQAIQTDVIYSK